MRCYLTCEWIKQETQNIWSFGLASTMKSGIPDIAPGRFVVIDFPDMSGRVASRCYSITATEDSGAFQISVKRNGRDGVADSLVSRLRPGGLVALSEVAGDIGVECLLSMPKVLMLASGIGVTVPMGLLRGLAKLQGLGRDVPLVRLVVVVRDVADLPFLPELLALHLGSDWFDLHVRVTGTQLLSANECFAAGRPTFEQVFGELQWDCVVICGSHAFADAYQGSIRRNLPGCQLYVEVFTASEVEAGHAQPGAVVVANVDGKALRIDSAKTLLDALAEHGVAIPSQCRSGICGRCRVKVSGGSCRSAGDFALSRGDRENGYVLACCTYPVGVEVSIEVERAVR